MSHSKKLLIGISGSIAAFKTASVISYFRKQGWEVRIITTTAARQFIGEATLEGLSGHPVLSSDFTSGHMMSHIDLARWADVFLVAPATVKTLAGFSTGAGDGILFSTYLAYEAHKPLLIAPAMNSQMLAHPATRLAIQTLKDRGAQILQTQDGLLACGEVGDGRMMEPEDMIVAVEKALLPTKNHPVLITMGGTRVPIDHVRSITNTSTGGTGAQLADMLALRGYDVTVLASTAAKQPRLVNKKIPFDTFSDFQSQLENTLQQNTYKTIIHMAAVSDFVVDSGELKINSGTARELQLVPTPKLISVIRNEAPQSLLIGFKLTVRANAETVEKAVDSVFKSGADVVIHNDLASKTDKQHALSLYINKKSVRTVKTSDQLVELIEMAIQQKPKQPFTEVTL